MSIHKHSRIGLVLDFEGLLCPEKYRVGSLPASVTQTPSMTARSEQSQPLGKFYWILQLIQSAYDTLYRHTDQLI